MFEALLHSLFIARGSGNNDRLSSGKSLLASTALKRAYLIVISLLCQTDKKAQNSSKNRWNIKFERKAKLANWANPAMSMTGKRCFKKRVPHSTAIV